MRRGARGRARCASSADPRACRATPSAAPPPPRRGPRTPRSAANSVRPIEPSGTSPSSMTPPDRRSQSDAAEADAEREDGQQQRHHLLVAAQDLVPEPRNCARASAPKNQNHEMPRIERNTECDLARDADHPPGLADRVPADAQLGSSAGAGGIAARRRASPRPRSRSPPPTTTAGPVPGTATRTPPRMVPTRIARNVPSSTRALPRHQLGLGEVLRQDAVLDRAEERRVHAHHEERARAGSSRCAGGSRPRRRT